MADPRPTLLKMASSLTAVLGLSVLAVGGLVALSHTGPSSTSVRTQAAAAPEVAAPDAAAPAETPAAPAEAPVDPGVAADLQAWGKEMTPKLFAYTSTAAEGDEVKTREEAQAWCAGLTDEIDGMAGVRAAPDPVVESEYRATVSESKEVVAACLNGDGTAMKSHNEAMTQHMEAMLNRFRQVDPESASDG
jgi:hypothetical protein